MSNPLLFLSKIFTSKRRITHRAGPSPPIAQPDKSIEFTEIFEAQKKHDMFVTQDHLGCDEPGASYAILKQFKFPQGHESVETCKSSETSNKDLDTEEAYVTPSQEEYRKYEHMSPFDRVSAIVQENYKSPLDRNPSWYDNPYLVPVVPEKELDNISKQVCGLSLSTPDVKLPKRKDVSVYSGSCTSRTRQSSKRDYEIIGVINKELPHILLARQKIRRKGRVVNTRTVISCEEEPSKHGKPPIRALIETHVMMTLSDQVLKMQAGYDCLVHYIDHFSIESGGTMEINLVMQYCEFGSAQDFFKNSTLLPANILRQLTKDVTMGLVFMHSLKIAHRDIKPGNMFFTYDHHKNRIMLKLADFGFSAASRSTLMYEDTIPGTLHFASPELIQSVPRDIFACDIWALGASFFVMLERKGLFATDRFVHDRDKCISLIKDDARRIYSSHPEEFNSLQYLINSMTDVDQNIRANIYDVAISPWIQGECEPLTLKTFGDYHLSK